MTPETRAAIDAFDWAERHAAKCAKKTVVTEFVYPPIPDRSSDWRATFDDYDCDCDQDGFFSHDPVGYGRTREEAIAALWLAYEESES